MVFTRKNQLLLNFLKVKLIVNDREIYVLTREQPVSIALEGKASRIVATDGYHITPPLELSLPSMHVFNFNVVCAIDDNRLVAGLLVWVLFYLVGLTSGFWLPRLISFLPIVYFLYLYYINRRDFIQILPA